MQAGLSPYSDTVPQRYERFLGPLFFEPFARHLATFLPDGMQGPVLEIACGTGRLTRHLRFRMDPASRLFATDIQPDMLSLARQLLTDPGIDWQTADVHDLPFAAATFPVVVCQFGVMFFASRRKAFDEIARVLQPRGRFLFNTWDAAKANPVAQLFQDTLNEVLGARAPDFGQKGPYSFYQPVEITSLLKSSGLEVLTLEKLRLTGIASTAEQVVEGFLYGSPLGPFLNKCSPEENS
ncbi:MAG TPA: class I SAM-dependent methyltransferase, partial [Chitinophagaceae bacterium]|nr:class I SAM-dependent methyltransferase [Chitinophagaceae bacterium]